ncbi:fungal-specific transcription factor domain-containing protein [Aspergillus navahoensis]
MYPTNLACHLDPLEQNVLEQRGVFDLPDRSMCDTLVETFFNWVAPIVPIIDRVEFQRHYQDPKSPPSLLLLHAMFTVASRSHSRGSQETGVASPWEFYKKAKALYDAGYERDPIPLIQSTLLLSLYWEGPDDVTENGLFYWSRLSIALAQAHGLHLRERISSYNLSTQRLLRRVWWALYVRDRAVAAAFGRPTHIDLDDCTVGSLALQDFRREFDCPDYSRSDADEDALFFIEYVNLWRVLEKIPSQVDSSVSALEGQIRHTAQSLHAWYTSCPSSIHWRPSCHEFLPSLLCSSYYAAICSIHLQSISDLSEDSQISCLNAATMIVSVLETLHSHGQLQYAPTFVIWHALLSYVSFKVRLSSQSPSLLYTFERGMETLIQLLRELSSVWPIATPVMELLQTATPNDRFSEVMKTARSRLQQQANSGRILAAEWSRHAPIRRLMPKHIFLPRSRIIVRSMASGVLHRPLYKGRKANPARDTVQSV